MVGNYLVITLRGSTLFKDVFFEAKKTLKLAGNILRALRLVYIRWGVDCWHQGEKSKAYCYICGGCYNHLLLDVRPEDCDLVNRDKGE